MNLYKSTMSAIRGPNQELEDQTKKTREIITELKILIIQNRGVRC